jgi:hypothetical protein
LLQKFVWQVVQTENRIERGRRLYETLGDGDRLGRRQNRPRRVPVRHPRGRNTLRLSHRDAGVDPVPPFHVLVVIGPVCEVVLALVARVGPLPRVLPAMGGQHALEAEALAAKLARERHRPGVYPLVLLQSAPLAELPAADIALMGLQPRVDRAVFPQPDEGLEGLTAGRAGEGSRRRVGQEVVVQVALLDETLAALVARVVSDAGMDALMGHQVRLGSKPGDLSFSVGALQGDTLTY